MADPELDLFSGDRERDWEHVGRDLCGVFVLIGDLPFFGVGRETFDERDVFVFDGEQDLEREREDDRGLCVVESLPFSLNGVLTCADGIMGAAERISFVL